MSEPLGHPASGRIVGRYVLHDEIAAGGMATVHIGRLVGPVGFSRTVAIKRLHPQLARDPGFSSKFLEEARLASRVRHTNVVSVVDVVNVAQELFLVMDYVQGDSLSRLFRAATEAGESGPIPRGIALTIMADALYGLHAAHETKGENGEPLLIVHRDVSPQNIIVGVDGISRVLDFGVAKAASHEPTAGDVLKGKLSYMAPEQYLRKPIDRRADIFAASIVLWELLTGKRLFSSNEPAAVLHHVLHEEIERPSVHAPDLPPALEAIVMKGLSRDVNERFATAHEMAAAIEASTQLTRPAEVGAWVERTVGDTLRERAERVAQIEGTSSSGALLPPVPSARSTDGVGESTMVLREPAAGESTMVLREADAVDITLPSTVESTRPPPPLGRRAGAYAALVALVLAGLVLASMRPWTKATSGGAEPRASSPGPPVESAVLSAASVPSAPSAPPSASPPASGPAGHPSLPPSTRVKTGQPVPPGVFRKGPRRDGDCSPPYYFDEDGVKRFKPKCL